MQMSERETLLKKISELEGEQVSSLMSNGTLEELRRCVAWLLAGKPWLRRSLCEEVVRKQAS